jgi:hypothetical protein
VADHQLAGLGVDRVERTYSYRPRYARSGDMTVARLPIICGQRSAALPGAAVGVFGHVSGAGGVSL